MRMDLLSAWVIYRPDVHKTQIHVHFPNLHVLRGMSTDFCAMVFADFQVRLVIFNLTPRLVIYNNQPHICTYDILYVHTCTYVICKTVNGINVNVKFDIDTKYKHTFIV